MYRQLGLEGQALVFGQRRDDRIRLAAEFSALLGDQLVERGDPCLDQRDLRAIGGVVEKLPELRSCVGLRCIHLPNKLQDTTRRGLWIEHLLFYSVGREL